MKVIFNAKSIDMFKKSIDLLKESLEYMNLECRKSGLFVNSINLSQTGMLQMFMDGSEMEEYECGKNPTLGIRLDAFQKSLKSLSTSQSLVLELEDETLKAHGRGKYNVSMDFKLCDVDAMTQNVDVEYDATCTLDAKILYNVIKDLSNVGGEVNVSVADGQLSFEVTGIDIGRTKIDMDDIEDLDLESSIDSISLKFGISDLLKYAKVYAIADTVQLHLKEDKPICLHYTLKNGFGWFRCFLAPML